LNSVLIIIPTYDEAKNIERQIDSIWESGQPVDILVVDDNSPDGTAKIVQNLMETKPNLYLLNKIEDTGFAKAYLSGFRFALEKNKYHHIVQMDADGSHQAKHLVDMIAALEFYDYVIGSRWIKGGRVINWPVTRTLLSRFGNLYSRFLLRAEVADVTSGFKAISVNTLRSMDVFSMTTRGYSFQIELFLRARQVGAVFHELPIEFIERSQGESKMHLKIVKEALIFVTRTGLCRK
jgi:dolichol-phosphate mannosyltransferase